MTRTNYSGTVSSRAAATVAMPRARRLDLGLSARLELLLGPWPLVAIALFLWVFLIPLELSAGLSA